MKSWINNFSGTLTMLSKGSLGATLKLLSCDWKVMGSSHGNTLLCKKQGKTAYYTPKWWDLFSDAAYAGALVHRAALID